jgi:LAO/AO transport system kinase
VTLDALVAGVRAGDRRAGARLMRALDDERPAAREALRALFPATGRAYRLGLTGNPGAGKSTLADQLVGAYRARGLRVGVVAVDPTSPFSGGAILGDRIRMQRHALDPDVFIRSLATRGALGGLSRSTGDVVDVLDAMGHDVVLIETVGVGQDEVDVLRLADTALVVTVPGLGDDVQAIKAGLLEIADVLVVNKADREGASRTVRDLETMLGLRQRDRREPSTGTGTASATRAPSPAAGPTRRRPACGRSCWTGCAGRPSGGWTRPAASPPSRPRWSPAGWIRTPSWTGCSPKGEGQRPAAGGGTGEKPGRSGRPLYVVGGKAASTG